MLQQQLPELPGKETSKKHGEITQRKVKKVLVAKELPPETGIIRTLGI
jgi:hypothetical protein